jgi:hypothetical protein
VSDNHNLFEVIAILAEDVRTEIGNKHTIIGALAGELMIPSVPANLKLSAYIVINFKYDGNRKIALGLNIGDTLVATSHSQVTTVNKLPVVLVIPAGIITISEPSIFTIDISVNGGEKRPLITAPIVLSPPGLGAPPA